MLKVHAAVPVQARRMDSAWLMTTFVFGFGRCCGGANMLNVLAAAGMSAPLFDGDIDADFEIEAIVGRGQFGAVYRARHRPSGDVRALKKITCR